MNYPDGFIPRVEKSIVELKCPKCGYEWETLMLTEFGMSYFADEDNGDKCPECGEEGELI